MSNANDAGTSVFFNDHVEGFGQLTRADDDMHWEAPDEVTDPALSETQFLGFNVPEHDINVFTYLWAHPNLGSLTTGVWGYQGVKCDTLAAELADFRDHHSDAPLRENGLSSVEFDNGYRVDVVEPFEKIRIRYDDSSRQNSFDITATAIMPAAGTANGKHFEQAMRTEGRLVLRGKAYVVGGHHMRDRTWGETRQELALAVPPLHWTSPIFGDDFALSITAVDDPAASPAWEGIYDFTDEMARGFNRGWVWRDGRLLSLVSTAVRTTWDPSTGYPTRQEVDVVDSEGRELHLVGTITAANTWHVFTNIRVAFTFARFECEGRTGWGEVQSVAWTDFVHHLMSS